MTEPNDPTPEPEPTPEPTSADTPVSRDELLTSLNTPFGDNDLGTRLIPNSHAFGSRSIEEAEEDPE